MSLRKLQGFFFRVNIISKVTVIGKVLKNTAQWPVNVGERFLWTLQCRPTRCKAFLDLQALAKIKESYGKNQRKWDWKGPAQCTCSTPGLDGSRPDAAAGRRDPRCGSAGGPCGSFLLRGQPCTWFPPLPAGFVTKFSSPFYSRRRLLYWSSTETMDFFRPEFSLSRCILIRWSSVIYFSAALSPMWTLPIRFTFI